MRHRVDHSCEDDGQSQPYLYAMVTKQGYSFSFKQRGLTMRPRVAAVHHLGPFRQIMVKVRRRKYEDYMRLTSLHHGW